MRDNLLSRSRQTFTILRQQICKILDAGTMFLHPRSSWNMHKLNRCFGKGSSLSWGQMQCLQKRNLAFEDWRKKKHYNG